MGMTHNLPTPKELASMKADLSFKHNEMQKSESTAMGLATGELAQPYVLSELAATNGRQQLAQACCIHAAVLRGVSAQRARSSGRIWRK